MKLRLIRVGLILPIPVIKRLSSYDVCFLFCMCSIFLFLKSGFFFSFVFSMSFLTSQRFFSLWLFHLFYFICCSTFVILVCHAWSLTLPLGLIVSPATVSYMILFMFPQFEFLGVKNLVSPVSLFTASHGRDS